MAMVLASRSVLVLVLVSGVASCTDLSILDCDPPSLVVSTDVLASMGLTVGDTHVAILGDRPHLASECTNVLGDPARCVDRDGDGMTDAWEADALRQMRPIVRFDRDEPLFCDRGADVAMVGRVTPAPEPDRFRAFIAILYSFDYGRCSVAAHVGDVERLVLDLRAVSSTEMIIVGVYAAAHEYTSFDGGATVLDEDVLGALELVPASRGSARWVVYSSSSKHATYLGRDACAAHESLICAREACQPPSASDDHDLLLPILNAGEPDAVLTAADDEHYDGVPLDSIGADAWTTAPFCPERGTNRTPCGPGAIREKLLRDPFISGHPELLHGVRN